MRTTPSLGFESKGLGPSLTGPSRLGVPIRERQWIITVTHLPAVPPGLHDIARAKGAP